MLFWALEGKTLGSRVIEYARKGANLKRDRSNVIPSYAPDVAARIEEIIKLRAHGLYQVTSSGPERRGSTSRGEPRVSWLGIMFRLSRSREPI